MVDQDVALSVFTKLEKPRRAVEDAIDPFIVPVYEVRLTARENKNMDRDYMVRVTPACELGADDWLYVLEVAGEHDLSVDLQNAGMELT
jgi:hypothetical protein